MSLKFLISFRVIKLLAFCKVIVALLQEYGWMDGLNVYLHPSIVSKNREEFIDFLYFLKTVCIKDSDN